jgi:hypothetical protein
LIWFPSWTFVAFVIDALQWPIARVSVSPTDCRLQPWGVFIRGCRPPATSIRLLFAAALRDGKARDRDFPRPTESSRRILEFLFGLVVCFGRGIPLSFDRAL